MTTPELDNGDVVKFTRNVQYGVDRASKGEYGIIRYSGWSFLTVRVGDPREKRDIMVGFEDLGTTLELVRKHDGNLLDLLDTKGVTAWWQAHYREYVKDPVAVRAIQHKGIRWLVPDQDLVGIEPEVPSGKIHYDARVTRYTLLTEGGRLNNLIGARMVAQFNQNHPELDYRYVLAQPTRVIFRVWKDVDQAVIAIFPEIAGNHGWECSMFEHIGQHGDGDIRGVIEKTRPATPEEYAPLVRELERYPYFYQLKVVQRDSNAMYHIRAAEVRRLNNLANSSE